LPTPLGRAHGERFIHCGLSTAKVGKGLRELEKPSQDRPAGGESLEQIADPVVIGADFGRESCQARGVETGAPGRAGVKQSATALALRAFRRLRICEV
jgi:hypothetical protein